MTMSPPVTVPDLSGHFGPFGGRIAPEALMSALEICAVTLTELDNTIGPEVVLWSDPLISSADSSNWTLTFASTSFATNTVPPVVVHN